MPSRIETTVGTITVVEDYEEIRDYLNSPGSLRYPEFTLYDANSDLEEQPVTLDTTQYVWHRPVVEEKHLEQQRRPVEVGER